MAALRRSLPVTKIRKIFDYRQFWQFYSQNLYPISRIIPFTDILIAEEINISHMGNGLVFQNNITISELFLYPISDFMESTVYAQNNINIMCSIDYW